jgi:hypothetical protein
VTRPFTVCQTAGDAAGDDARIAESDDIVVREVNGRGGPAAPRHRALLRARRTQQRDVAVLVESETIADAVLALGAVFEVESQVLRRDLERL